VFNGRCEIINNKKAFNFLFEHVKENKKPPNWLSQKVYLGST